jgi:predicted nucleic acid-binding protein
MPASGVTLLDACAVVSLYATRRMAEVLTACEGTVAVSDVVAREAQYVRRGGTGEDATEREPVDLAALVAAGTVQIVTTDDENELLTFVDLTRELDDGEAMTAALAIHRGYVVVTDDRKAERVLNRRNVPLRSTLDLIKTWVDAERLDLTIQRTVLLDLRQRGTYEPRRLHPFRPWWDTVMGSQ